MAGPAFAEITSIISSLAKILAAAENLEELILDFNCKLGHLQLEETYLGTYTWSHLQSLYLRNRRMDEEELTNLLYRHRQTLKRLRLVDYIDLKHGTNAHSSWWRWAKEIHRWMSSSLEQIELKYLGYTGLDSVPKCCCLKSIILQGSSCSNGQCCNYEAWCGYIYSGRPTHGLVGIRLINTNDVFQVGC
jgi:hypothetical protein